MAGGPERDRQAGMGACNALRHDAHRIPETLLAAIEAVAGSDTLAYVPDVARRLGRLGVDAQTVKSALLAACSAGSVELRPEGGIRTLTLADRRLCVSGWQGAMLSYCRVMAR